jgi:hypothetical protein
LNNILIIVFYVIVFYDIVFYDIVFYDYSLNYNKMVAISIPVTWVRAHGRMAGISIDSMVLAEVSMIYRLSLCFYVYQAMIGNKRILLSGLVDVTTREKFPHTDFLFRHDYKSTPLHSMENAREFDKVRLVILEYISKIDCHPAIQDAIKRRELSETEIAAIYQLTEKYLDAVMKTAIHLKKTVPLPVRGSAKLTVADISRAQGAINDKILGEMYDELNYVFNI